MDDVILAVASPPGRAMRGIVRLSGEQAHDLILPLLEFRDRTTSADVRATGFHRTVLHVFDQPLPCLILIDRAPRSYTSENCAEFFLPGNPVLLDRVIDALIQSGRSSSISARRAGPGEFTARAFLHGRMTLAQAEGIEATIIAQSDAELRAARLLTSGALGRKSGELADQIAHALALVEAGIDFTDQEDVTAIEPETLVDVLLHASDAIASMLAHAIGTEALHAIPWVVLTGPPNAGKSSLFNALLDRDRAIVSTIAGTTRDVLAEPLALPTGYGGAEVMLIDLAGEDETDSLINARMQIAARAARERAELLLYCTAEWRTPANIDEHTLRIGTKEDLADGQRSMQDIDLAVSAKTGEGLEALRMMIAARMSDRAVSLASDALALKPRHESALRAANEHLRSAIELTRADGSRAPLAESELVAASMRAALDELGAISGAVTPDDILGRIFAGFCIGK